MAGRSVAQRWTYDLSRVLARLVGVIVFHIRCQGRCHVPAEGAALVCANHQSFLDPVLVGLACDRRLTYLARQSLFRWAPFRRLILWYDTIPIQHDGLGIGGVKETIRRLRRGQMVLVFPETNPQLMAPIRCLRNMGRCVWKRLPPERFRYSVQIIGRSGAPCFSISIKFSTPESFP